MKLLKLMETGSKYLLTNANKYAPQILSGVAIVGVFVTSYFAAVGHKAACEELSKQKEEAEKAGKEVDTLDKIKVAAPHYAAAVLSGAATCGCVVASCAIGQKRLVAMGTAYALSQKALDEYKTEAKELLGERKFEKMEGDIHKKNADSLPIPKEFSGEPKGAMDVTGNAPPVRCLDEVTGRMFWSTIDEIRRAERNINAELFNVGFVSLNDFYSDIGLEVAKIGDEIGWNAADGPVDIKTTAIIGADGYPTICVSGRISPRYDFRHNL